MHVTLSGLAGETLIREGCIIVGITFVKYFAGMIDRYIYVEWYGSSKSCTLSDGRMGQ